MERRECEQETAGLPLPGKGCSRGRGQDVGLTGTSPLSPVGEIDGRKEERREETPRSTVPVRPTARGREPAVEPRRGCPDPGLGAAHPTSNASPSQFFVLKNAKGGDWEWEIMTGSED